MTLAALVLAYTASHSCTAGIVRRAARFSPDRYFLLERWIVPVKNAALWLRGLIATKSQPWPTSYRGFSGTLANHHVLRSCARQPPFIPQGGVLFKAEVLAVIGASLSTDMPPLATEPPNNSINTPRRDRRSVIPHPSHPDHPTDSTTLQHTPIFDGDSTTPTTPTSTPPSDRRASQAGLPAPSTSQYPTLSISLPKL